MTKAQFVDFFRELIQKLPLFVGSMENMSVKGKYRFSYSGDLIAEKMHWGLGQTTFATRILYIINSLNEQKKSELADFILSFQTNKGAFFDKEIAKKSINSRVTRAIKNCNIGYLSNAVNIRAETRQALAALINLDRFPKVYFRDTELSEKSILKYVNSLDWSNPWSAGSHFNHQLFFLCFDPDISDAQKTSYVRMFLDNLANYCQKDGFYQKDKTINANIMVGGMMKILMGLSLFDKAKEFILPGFADLCLDKMKALDACENFNTVYTLYQCATYSDYRRDEIEKFALYTADRWKDFYYSQYGGFSFSKKKSGVSYYGAVVSKGLNEPDLHGTAMFVWGFLIIAKILGIDGEVGLREPVL